ncbi:MAG: hypothetical protein RLZZ324_266 [Candidatus Parcubacteria bacterium]|jgi:glucose-6-phosphate isomerase
MPAKRTDLPKYDPAFMYDDRVGAEGMPSAEIGRLEKSLDAARQAILSEPPGFFSIPDRGEELRATEKLAREVAGKFKTLIVIGIGGSDLGARAIIGALGGRAKGMEVRFIGANTDPEEIAALLKSVDLRKCALNVISKSGGTLETMATFLLLREALIKKVGVRKHAAHVIATTDESGGALREIARREGYRTLPVPQGIGGRYSALTTVGLFPAACAGIPVRALVEGARQVLADFKADAAKESGPLLFAGLHVDASVRRGKTVTVLMPYSAALREMGYWFRQLWAESLGKARDRRGAQVHRGFTPVAALGATDQHSQLQLYVEGPNDKCVTFLQVEKPREDFKVPVAYKDLPAVSWLGGKKFSDLIRAEREATAEALADAGRPSGTVHVARVSPESVGGLMMFFMLATAAAAELLDVNAYDQPGVEDGKRLIREAFKKN